MTRTGDEPPALVARRALEIVARQLFRHFLGRVPLEELMSLGAPVVPDVLTRWDGRGRLAPFAMQRARWTILRELRRQGRRDQRASFRNETAALFSTEDAARGIEGRKEPAAGERSFVESFVEQAAIGFTLEISAGDPTALVDPEQDVERDAERMAVRRAVERLPAPVADLLDRYYYRGETLDEMATALDVKRSTLSDRLERAREQLRQALDLAGEEATVIPLRAAARKAPRER